MTRHDDQNHDDLLEREIAAWKAATSTPAAALRSRVLAAIEAAVEAAPGQPRAAAGAARKPAADRGWLQWWSWQGALAAAVLVLAVGVGVLRLSQPAVESTRGKLVLSEALESARAAERAHARAIAALEQAAEPVLARARDPRTAAGEAALLLAYRDRLVSLDSTIAQVNAYLDENPGLASARTVLLAAYIDKTRLLEEIIQHTDPGEIG